MRVGFAGWWAVLIGIACSIIVGASGLFPARSQEQGSPAQPEKTGPPARLQETGLYSDFVRREIDPRCLAYAPQYPLWSDGAAKRRWIYLPEGARIDAADPDVWLFPAGVKIWKEFSFHGRPVETRLLESQGKGVWRYATYVWAADGSDAPLAPAEGLRGVVEIIPGVRHDIPSTTDCEACHQGRQGEALGFSALQLSPDRDPLAAHAARPAAGMIDLRTLLERGWIQSAPAAWRDHPPRISAATPNERAALGYLHANCGQCHHPGNNLGNAALILRHSAAPGAGGEPAVLTTVDRVAIGFRLPHAGDAPTLLVRPGDPEHSAIYFRMDTRNPYRQMPPLGTRIIDSLAVAQVGLWIRNELGADGVGSSDPR